MLVNRHLTSDTSDWLLMIIQKWWFKALSWWYGISCWRNLWNMVFLFSCLLICFIYLFWAISESLISFLFQHERENNGKSCSILVIWSKRFYFYTRNLWDLRYGMDINLFLWQWNKEASKLPYTEYGTSFLLDRAWMIHLNSWLHDHSLNHLDPSTCSHS